MVRTIVYPHPAPLPGLGEGTQVALILLPIWDLLFDSVKLRPSIAATTDRRVGSLSRLRVYGQGEGKNGGRNEG